MQHKEKEHSFASVNTCSTAQTKVTHLKVIFPKDFIYDFGVQIRMQILTDKVSQCCFTFVTTFFIPFYAVLLHLKVHWPRHRELIAWSLLSMPLLHEKSSRGAEGTA